MLLVVRTHISQFTRATAGT